MAKPMFYNAMSYKVMQELLLPKGRKTAAERATTLKHDPFREFQDSVYRRRDGERGPTLLTIPSRMCKAAVADVAKRVPGGGTTAAVQQLVSMVGENIDVYGVPQIHLGCVRNSDINRTPDVRTRAILPRWACRVSIRYVQPQLSIEAVATLLQAAGKLNGFGDFRQQKGDGNFGQFRIVDEGDKEFQEILAIGARKAQEAAMQDPAPYDLETERLLDWYESEVGRRRDQISEKLAAKEEKAKKVKAPKAAAGRRTRSAA